MLRCKQAYLVAFPLAEEGRDEEARRRTRGRKTKCGYKEEKGGGRRASCRYGWRRRRKTRKDERGKRGEGQGMVTKQVGHDDNDPRRKSAQDENV